jgi:hypothetical protein
MRIPQTRNLKVPLWLAAAFVLCLSAQVVSAQSTIVNVPSTDIVSAKKVYVEFDFITNYAWERHDSFQTYEPRAVVGLGHNIEVGANVALTHVSGQDSPVEIQPNIKWRFYNNETIGVSASVGCMVYAPVANTAGTNTLVHCFTMTSKKFNGLHGPRFTGGAYALLHGQDQDTRFGAVIGYEQKITKRIGFVTDWTSGDNRLGYLNPGFNFVTTKNSSLTAGYSVANHGRGKNALFFYYGALF